MLFETMLVGCGVKIIGYTSQNESIKQKSRILLASGQICKKKHLCSIGLCT
jgi:hypothetical protein